MNIQEISTSGIIQKQQKSDESDLKEFKKPIDNIRLKLCQLVDSMDEFLNLHNETITW